MSDIRTQRQKEFAKAWIDSGKFGILNIAPRTGKCRVGIFALQEIGMRKVLIAYPDNKIKSSWEKEFKIFEMDDEKFVTYTNFRSLDKYVDEKFDVIIWDEIHLLSEAQLEVCEKMLENNKVVMGLTGTLAYDTESVIKSYLGLSVVVFYPIETAIKEGVVVDYEINIIQIPLDDKLPFKLGKNIRTEKKHYNHLCRVIEKFDEDGKDTKLLRFNRMRFLQNLPSKRNLVKRLLMDYKDERVLVFCGTIKMADSLGIPSHHSKSKSDKGFGAFVEGKGKHFAVVKIGNTGVTFFPLSRVIITAFDSNSENLTQKIFRSMSIEYNNPEKKALIYILTTTESVELRWLTKALVAFDSKKIFYIVEQKVG